MTITIKDFSAGYGKKDVLNGINIEFHPGQIIGMIGPNGAGKSTFIRGMSGVLNDISGEVIYKNEDTFKMSNAERARIISVVPQARQLGGAFSVYEVVMMGRTAYMNFLGQPSKKDVMRVEEAIKKTNLEDLADRMIAELSGGEQQKVLLARALAQETPVMILDEPTTHLDLNNQIEFMHIIKDLAEKENKIILLAEHDLNLVNQFADRVLVIHNGGIYSDGKPQDVISVEMIKEIYNADVLITAHPETKKPVVFPKI
jgi:iron complex transport system ATP-binding protein